jgi:hypothetical protein
VKTFFILLFGLLIGVGVVCFWPIIISFIYIVMALIVGIISGLWSLLVPVLTVLFVGYIVYLICKFFYTRGQKKGIN